MPCNQNSGRKPSIKITENLQISFLLQIEIKDANKEKEMQLLTKDTKQEIDGIACIPL